MKCKTKTSGLFLGARGFAQLLFCFYFVIVLRLPLRFFNQLAGVGKAEFRDLIAGDHAGQHLHAAIQIQRMDLGKSTVIPDFLLQRSAGYG